MDFLSDPTQLQTPQRNRYQLQENLNGQFNANSSIATNEFDSPKNGQLTSNSKRMMLLEFSPKQDPSNRHRNIVFSCENDNSYEKEDRQMQQNSFEYQQTACKSVQKKQIGAQNSSSNSKIQYDEEEYDLTSMNSQKKGRTIERQGQDELQQLNELDQQMNDMNIHTTSKKQKQSNNIGNYSNQNLENQQLWRNLQIMQDYENGSTSSYNSNSNNLLQQNASQFPNPSTQNIGIQEPYQLEQEKGLEYQKAYECILEFINSFNSKYPQISTKLSPSCVIEIKDQQTLPKQRMLDLMFSSISRIDIVHESINMKETNHRQISVQHSALFHLYNPNVFAQYQMFWRISLTIPYPTITHLSIFY